MGRKKTKKTVGSEAVSCPQVAAPSYLPQISDIFTCEHSPVFGRYLRCSRDIKKGTLILSEKHLVAGPMRSSGVICLGCHAEFRDSRSRAECAKCKWPVCGDKCSNSVFHIDECRFFVEHNMQPPPLSFVASACSFDFGAISILRALLLKHNNEAKWKLLQTLEHHSDLRKELPLWEENERNVVKPLIQLGLGNLFDVQDIHNICGIFEVNAFELGEEFSYRGIFPTAAMMAHDCIPNATHFEDSTEGIIQVRATVDIPDGTPITVCYAYTLQGTSLRRRMLTTTKFFGCVCERCSDPTEFGTHLSTLLCLQCSAGNVVNVKAKDHLNLWQCDSCEAKVNSGDIEQLVDKYMCQAEGVHGVETSEAFVQECSKYFHKNHFIPLGVKFNLSQAYGREKVLHELPQAQLERKLTVCTDVMKILNIITPGLTITRGLVLYELQATEIILSRRIFESRKFSKAFLKRRLEGTLKILNEAIEILSLSHPTTPEYALAVAAKAETLPDLKRWILMVKAK